LGVDDYYGRGISGELVQECQVFINSQNLYDQPVDSLEQAYRHLVSAFPSVCNSEFFDEDFRTTKYLNCQHLSAAPPDFSSQISSGVQTSALNSEIVVQIKFTTDSFSTNPVVADTFLCSDVVISLSSSGGELSIKY
jgi:K+-transporting ATPase c subunit